MKVLLINGSPHKNGCTYTALCEVQGELEKAGIETQLVHIGDDPINGCIGCNGCAKIGRCVFNDDIVNSMLSLAETSDGFVFGSPVHYAGAAGKLVCLMDRMFYAGGSKCFENKPAACVVSARRSGTTAAFDQLIKYFTISNMPVVSSNYWNGVHGFTPEDVRKDEEGMQTMRNLGRNMAWLLRCIEAGRKAGVPDPVREKKIATHFIR